MSTPEKNGQGSKNDLLTKWEFWNTTHSLHSHPYLDRLFSDEIVAEDEIREFYEVLYRFCETFHDCLFALAVNTHNEEIRRAIVDNLFDEYGAGDRSRGHLVLMRQLGYSLGYTDQSLAAIQLNQGAKHFMSEIADYCREQNPVKAIACICIGAECNGSEYFRRIYNSFRRKPSLAGADLYILQIHAQDDIAHRERMLALIAPLLEDREARPMLEEGYLKSVNLFNELWTSMAYYRTARQAAVVGA